MKRIDSHNLNIGRGEILGFSCVRDEALRLPWFLEFHRRAGVDRFFIIDNDSADGTTEYLLDQPDVSLFRTQQSYAESHCGLDWLNGLLERYGEGHWVVTLDADELLVYPGCESIPLRHMTRYLQETGSDALRTVMIDMYSKVPMGLLSYEAGQSFLDACPFLDRDTYRRYSGGLPTRGGPRARVFWDWKRRLQRGSWRPPPLLQKIPLVSWRAGRTYRASTHKIDDVSPSELTGGILHFKFLQDFASRTALEVSRGEHFDGASQYTAYQRTVANEPNLTLYYEGSVRYRDSLQLVELGLQKLPDSFRSILERESDASTSPLRPGEFA